MRIIAGKHRSRKLMTLPNDSTRPTLDQVKESIFNKIGPYFQEGSVLDLFAGCGNIGLECLSRGFDKAVFVDNSLDAIAIIEENVRLLNEQDNVTILHSDYLSAIQQFENHYFDLVYIDPPYHLSEAYINSLNALIQYNCIDNDSLIILEASQDVEININESTFDVRLIKNYRKNKVIYLRMLKNEKK